MEFLDPKIDFVFKKLFGTQSKKEITISFLNSILEKENGDLITDITIIDPNDRSITLDMKLSIVDIRCIDQNKKEYIVEMQVSNQQDYDQRAQYYAAAALNRQLKKGESYDKLLPVIFIGVLGFKLFKTTQYLSHHYILNNKTHDNELDLLEFHFIELSKFKKEIDDNSSLSDKWIYLLKQAEFLETIPTEFNKDDDLISAMELLEKSRWSTKELETYERIIDAQRVHQSVMKTAQDIGMQKGIEEGIEKKEIEIVHEMLKNNFDIDMIAKITHLTLEKIRKIQATIKKL